MVCVLLLLLLPLFVLVVVVVNWQLPLLAPTAVTNQYDRGGGLQQ
jgi:hypothetical protein